jgi:tRNA-specific 2-thiouridylase
LQDKGLPAPPSAGEIAGTDGRPLGTHTGAHRFTVGQRRGLGIATGEPLYVIATDAATGRVTVGGDADLRRDELIAREVNWIAVPHLAEPVRAAVKIRHRHEPAAATLHPTADRASVRVRFDQPQRAITPGQAAVFYQDDCVLGGGWIE